MTNDELSSLKDQVEAAYEEQFMQPEIVLGDFVTLYDVPGVGLLTIPGEDFDPENESEEGFHEYNVYGVRLSAPGYVDYTDWSTFVTEEEALKFLLENTGE